MNATEISTMFRRAICLFIVLLLVGNTTVSYSQERTRYFCEHNLESVKWSPTEMIFAVQGFGGTRVYDGNLRQVSVLRVEEYSGMAVDDEVMVEGTRCWGAGVSWSPDGQYIATPINPRNVDDYSTIQIWEAATGDIVTELLAPVQYFSSTSSVDWHPNTSVIAYTGTTVRNSAGEFWRGIAINSIGRFDDLPEEHAALKNDLDIILYLGSNAVEMTQLAWSADGEFLAIAQADGNVQIWDTQDLEALTAMRTLTAAEAQETPNLLIVSLHTQAVNDLDWHPLMPWLASASDDGKVIIWDMDTSEIVATLEDHQGYIEALSWSTDGTHLAITDSTGIIVLASSDFRVVTRLDTQYLVRDLDWSFDDTMLISLHEGNSVNLWEMSSQLNH